MTTSGQTICLCMIVKDEAHVIERCLASVRPLVDHWVIVDTGSSDGTQDVVRKAMAGVPGALVERPWVDFGHNRSEALALARPHAAYSLIIDADDFFETPADFVRPVLSADSYVVNIEDAATAYQRTQLVRNALAWRYTGVLHEFVNCPEANSVGHFPLVMRRNHDGARRRNPETYRRDAAILERALETETDPFLLARYTFYLAQSWRDCGEREASLAAYLRRAELGFWNEETFVALLQAARLKEALGHPVDDTLATYARATATVPTRAEALHDGSKLCREKDRFEEGYWLAKRGAELPLPASGLFLEPWMYEYGLLDELGVHAYWSGRYEESRAACDKLLSERTSPDDVRTRVEGNRRFAVDKLGAGGAAPKPAAAARDDGSATSMAGASANGDRILTDQKGLSEAFAKIYETDAWSHGSGPGSRLDNTIEYRSFLERFIEANDVRTVTDLGCGDWQFSSHLDWSRVTYSGFDVVETIVNRNNARYARDNISFQQFLSIDDLPGGDLLISKEVLQHLPTATIQAYLPIIRARYRFALLTNSVEPHGLANTDIEAGGYRPLRLDEPPFDVPGAKVFTYFPQSGSFIFKNVVLLVTGTEMSRRTFPVASGPAAGPAAAALPTSRQPRASLPDPAPRILLTILAKQKAPVLPFFLACLDALDYPKSSIVLYVRTNNNKDATRDILKAWIERVSTDYAHVEFDDADVEAPVESFGVHEWNATRFRVLGEIRNVSLKKTAEHACAFYFVVDVDNFLAPRTLRELVALNLPIVAPLLRDARPGSHYANYHAAVDAQGYFAPTPSYEQILLRQVVGLIEVPVVHCTYLIRADVVPELRYDDGSGRHEYVVFSDQARLRGIPQLLDNRHDYGVLTLDDDNPDLLASQVNAIAKVSSGDA